MLPTVVDAGFARALLDGLLQRPSWHSLAACRGSGPSLFFPTAAQKAPTAALVICGRCPVREPCRAAGVEDPDLEGVWGATTKQDRRRLRAGRVAAKCFNCGASPTVARDLCSPCYKYEWRYGEQRPEELFIRAAHRGRERVEVAAEIAEGLAAAAVAERVELVECSESCGEWAHVGGRCKRHADLDAHRRRRPA